MGCKNHQHIVSKTKAEFYVMLAILLLSLPFMTSCSDNVEADVSGSLISDVYTINARMEITQLTTDYAWAVDKKNLDRMMSIWSQDAIYDLSNLGLGTVEGYDAITGFMQNVVLPGEPWCFSSISNVDVTFTGPDTAEGGDYFIHTGYVPVEVDDQGNVVRSYSQFNPSTADLLVNPEKVARRYKEGQHFYRFAKENGKWKITWMQGRYLYAGPDEIVDAGTIAQEMPSFFDDLKPQ